MTPFKTGVAVPVVGHERTREFLGNASQAGALTQTLLLSGPSGIGKSQMARWTAQLLLCRETSSAPCGQCRACRLVAESRHPDVHWLAAGLKIEAVRELQRQVVLSPTEASRRVAVVFDIDLATPAAANALLKTLEEPPRHVTIVLTTSAAADVLPTIRSRCQVVGLRYLPQESVLAALRGVSTGNIVSGAGDSEALLLLAGLAGGRVEWALRALRDPAVMDERQEWLDILQSCLNAQVHVRLEIAEELARPSTDLQVGLSHWRGWARDLLRMTADPHAEPSNLDRVDELRRWSQRAQLSSASALVLGIERALDRVAANVNRQLALDALVMDLSL